MTRPRRRRQGVSQSAQAKDGGEITQIAGDQTTHHHHYWAGEQAAQSAVGQVRVGALPRQLPPDVPFLCGRDEQIARITSGQVGTAVITGPGGVGKTALAVHIAHKLSGRYPDGQIFAEIGEQAEGRVTSHSLLARFIRALDEQAEIPDDRTARVHAYRSLMAGRRVLIVLDGVPDGADVADLLPSGPGCAVVMTSRARLGDVPATIRESLPPLSVDESIELLTKTVGTERISAEAAAIAEIVRLCGCLPLALRVIAGRLVNKSHWPISRAAEALRSESRRLSELENDNVSVRASLALTYRSLDKRTQRAFRMIGLLPGETFAAWSVSALLDLSYERADEKIESLVDVFLVEPAGESALGRARFQLHDLVRLYARELLDAEESMSGRARAQQRLTTAYLSVLQHAAMLRDPDVLPGLGRLPELFDWRLPTDAIVEATLQEPVGWFIDEAAAIMELTETAYENEDWPRVWQLAQALSGFLDQASALDEDTLVRVFDLAVDAAARTADAQALANARHIAGRFRLSRGDHEEAERLLLSAREHFKSVEDPWAAGRVEIALGEVDLARTRWAEARRHLATALEAFHPLGDSRGSWLAWFTLAECAGTQVDDGHGSKVKRGRSRLMFRLAGRIFHLGRPSWEIVVRSPISYDIKPRGPDKWLAGLRRATPHAAKMLAFPLFTASFLNGHWRDYPGPYRCGDFFAGKTTGSDWAVIRNPDLNHRQPALARIKFPHFRLAEHRADATEGDKGPHPMVRWEDRSLFHVECLAELSLSQPDQSDPDQNLESLRSLHAVLAVTLLRRFGGDRVRAEWLPSLIDLLGHTDSDLDLGLTLLVGGTSLREHGSEDEAMVLLDAAQRVFAARPGGLSWWSRCNAQTT